eukprot:6931075-Ditylum_brightwellii.AAC.1
MAHELHQLVDTANAPIYGIDVNGEVYEWNSKTFEITGFSKEEAFDISVYLHSLQKSEQEVLDKALHGNNPVRSRKYYYWCCGCCIGCDRVHKE